MVKKIVIVICLLLFVTVHYSQKTIVSGTVYDANTNETVPFATVSFKGTKTGVTTDIDGKYFISSYYVSDSLQVAFLGYKTTAVYIEKDKTHQIDFHLETSELVMDEFKVVADKKAENPAHALMRKVVRNKKINNRAKLDAYEYEVYNKIEFDINNLDEKFMKRKIFKKFDFIFDMVDSTDDKPYLPIFIVESISDYYYTRSPKQKKEIIKATKIAGPDNESISQYLGDMYQNVNVYDNNVNIFGRQFISPLNNNVLLHYKVYLTDSAVIDNNWCYKIQFMPRRKSDLAFVGEMWINDTTYAVKVFEAEIAGDANINFINSYKLKQKFRQVENEVWMMVLDETIADINPLESDKQKGFYGRKTTSYKDFIINKPRSDKFFKEGNNILVNDSSGNRSDEYWNEGRHLKLSEKENKIYHMIDTMKNLPVVKTYIDVIQTLVTGYKILGPIELGPYSSIYTYNPIEGHRFSLGMQTSNDFSKRIMFKGHVAYGITDQEWKYGLSTKFFITKKKSPRRIMEIKYLNEVLQFDRDLFEPYNQTLVSSFFRRNPYNKLLKVNGVRVHYYHEWFEGLANTISLKTYNIKSLGDVLKFSKSTGNITTTLDDLQNSEITFGMRYAKNEKFVSGEFNRVSLGSSSPIFDLNVSLGLKNILYSNYEYQKFKLNITDKIYFGYFGVFRYTFEIGKLLGTVPYPFLFVHQGNETWGYTRDYNAMNIGEFISDEYASLSVAHYFGGIFLNRIPLLRKLKWRELVTGKIVYGRLNQKHEELLDLPTFGYSLSDKPYAEVSVGIENIFKILRVDGLWRLTYLDNNSKDIDVLRFGIRAKLQFEF